MSNANPSVAQLSEERALSSRLRRVAAVMALCCIVMPATGFWMEANDQERGIHAVRLRIDHATTKRAASAPALSRRIDRKSVV